MGKQTKDNFEQILKLLSEAAQVEFYADMRRRFASDEQWKVEGPHIRKEAAIKWFTAKHMIGDDREALGKYLTHNKDKFSESQLNTYNAALKVIDKEIETQFEEQFLKEEAMGKRFQDQEPPYEEAEDVQEELDEDEEYVRQTSDDSPEEDDDSLWDGDEYLGGDEEDYEDDLDQ